jgi:hypothetical protein
VIRILVVELRRVVRDREEDLQQSFIGDLCRIERNLNRLRVTGVAFADAIVVRRGGVAAGVAGDGVRHAFDVLKDSLNAPEAAAREHGDLIAFRDARERVAGVRRGLGAWRFRSHSE